jgi:hypothetical protein
VIELDMGDWPSTMTDAGELLKQRDYKASPHKMQILTASRPSFSRNFWSAKASTQFPLLAAAAQKLLSAHVTTAAAEQNWSAWSRTYGSLRNALSKETAEKLVFTKANMPVSCYS